MRLVGELDVPAYLAHCEVGAVGGTGWEACFSRSRCNRSTSIVVVANAVDTGGVRTLRAELGGWGGG